MSKYLVFGHKNPDTDAIGAAIAFAHLLQERGHEAEAVALGTPNSETQFALDYFQLEAPRAVETVANETSRVALVDHNEKTQSVDDIDEVQVDYVVDHHRISNFETANPLFYRAEPIGSTSSVIYKLYQEYEVEIPKGVAGIMLSAIVSDTLLFKSPTSTNQDEAIGQALAEIAGVDIEEYGLDLLRAGADLSQKSEHEIVEGDAKTFEMNGKNVRIGQVNTIGFEDLLSRKANLLEIMEGEIVENSYDLYLLVMTDILDNDSIGLALGNGVDKVAQAFAGEITEHEIQLPGVVSRKKQVVPSLTEAYEKD